MAEQLNDFSPYLNVGVRAWTGKRKSTTRNRRIVYPPSKLLVVDTETTVDETQTLKFGSAQLVVLKRNGVKVSDGRILVEVLFYDDGLAVDDPKGYEVLVSYCRERGLKLISKSEFIEKWIWYYCVRRAGKNGKITGTGTLTGFNLPFDLSRLAYSHGEGRGRNNGSFSFRIFPDWNDSENHFRPRFICNVLDSKKSLMSWGSRLNSVKDDTGQHDNSGQFLDVRQLIWGMTNRSVSLATGCKLFGLPDEYCKGHAEEHGKITSDYIDYNRQDVTATAHLAIAALKDYSEHPINLQATKVFSPASVAKGYLRAMGIVPMLDRDTVPKDDVLLGNITSTFYGARAEAHIRNVPVPVTVNDFTSMYCLVNALLKHWDHITAKSVRVADVTAEFRQYVDTVTINGVLDKTQWSSFTGFVLIKPDEDIVPVRAEYSKGSGYNVGINKLKDYRPYWYAMPDVIASRLLTGKTPEILKAIRFVPSKQKLSTLKPVQFMGTVTVEPANTDFFRKVTEQRSAIKANRTCAGKDGCTCLSCRTIEALKVTSNSGSYGIYVEMLRTDQDTETETETYGMYDTPWSAKTTAIETAQEFCYPSIGSVITSGARLLLAVLERLVTDAGGTWLFCDTDSMAVVCDETGSLIPCPGGQHRMPDGSEAVRALTRRQMTSIRNAVNRLNPFDTAAVPLILKDETSKTNQNGQAYGYAISSKRYTLFTYVNGLPIVPEQVDGKEAYKRHGLGLYLNPVSPFCQPEDRQWIRQTWQHILDKSHGLNPSLPDWAHNPALGRVSVSSPYVMRVLREYNHGKPYKDQVKPYGFVLTVSEKSLGMFTDQEPRRFISPYSNDPGVWLQHDWYDLHNSGANPVKIATNPDDNGSVLVKSMREVIREYELHPEEKYLPPQQGGWGSISPLPHGILSRRIVKPASIQHIGKESNKLEDVQNQLISKMGDIVTEYSRKELDVIRKAFEGYSYRRIAEMVNAESDAIRERPIPLNHFTGERMSTEQGSKVINREYGKPVRVNHEVISRFFAGIDINPDNASAIERTAAKFVGRIDGLQDRIGYANDMISPRVALAHWAETGYETEFTRFSKRASGGIRLISVPRKERSAT